MKPRLRRIALAVTVGLVIPAWVLASPPSQAKVIGGGTTIWLRTNEAIDMKQATDGQAFGAVVNSDVVDENGAVAIPKGSDAQLIVRKESNGKMFLALNSVTVNGTRYRVETGNVSESNNSKEGIGKNSRTAKMLGGGAVLGTLLGAIAGGGKGAAIGAISGATAGGVVQEITKSKPRIPAETLLHFRLQEPLRLEANG